MPPEQQNCVLCNSDLKKIGIGGWRGGWECKKCATSLPLTTNKIRAWDKRYGIKQEILINPNQQELDELESHQLLARATRTPKERKKKPIDYITPWFKDHKLRKMFKNGQEFIAFCKKFGYGSSQPGTMQKHLDILKQHRKQQIVELGE